MDHWCSVVPEKSQPSGPPFSRKLSKPRFPPERWALGLEFFCPYWTPMMNSIFLPPLPMYDRLSAHVRNFFPAHQIEIFVVFTRVRSFFLTYQRIQDRVIPLLARCWKNLSHIPTHTRWSDPYVSSLSEKSVLHRYPCEISVTNTR